MVNLRYKVEPRISDNDEYSKKYDSYTQQPVDWYFITGLFLNICFWNKCSSGFILNPVIQLFYCLNNLFQSNNIRIVGNVNIGAYESRFNFNYPFELLRAFSILISQPVQVMPSILRTFRFNRCSIRYPLYINNLLFLLVTAARPV